MEKEKKKPGKLKKILIAIVVIFVLFYIIGGSGGDNEETDTSTKTENLAETEEETEQSETEVSETEASDINQQETTDTRYQIGDTVPIKRTDGGEYNLTFTEWGVTKDFYDNSVLYIKYTMENTGTEPIYTQEAFFDVYADDYLVESTSVPSQNQVAKDVSGQLTAGRKMESAIYKSIDPNTASVIELDFAGVTFVIKDDTLAANEYEAYETTEDGKDVLEQMVGTYTQEFGSGMTIVIEKKTDYTAVVTFKSSADAEPDFVFDDCVIAEGMTELYVYDDSEDITILWDATNLELEVRGCDMADYNSLYVK